MKRIAFAAFLVTGLTSALAADAQTLYTCGEGTVRHVQSVTETAVNPAAAARPANPGESAARTETAPEQTPASYFVTVELLDTVYTGRSSADAAWNFDPTRLAIGDGISVCANSTQMVLDRLDGTDYRARIVRIDRDAKRSLSSEAR